MAAGNVRPLAEVTEVNGVTIVTFRDLKIPDGQSYATETLEKVVRPLVDQNAGRKFILDMATVDFLPSHAIGKLVVLRKRIEEGRGDIRLCSLRPEIYDVFRVTGLHRLFRFATDQKAALADLGAA